MVADFSSEEYVITRAKILIRLALRRVTELRPHEETVASDLERLVSLLGREPVLRHPLVADERTGLVLDGTHRLAALKQLDCTLAPCALVDYQDQGIKVDRWFRIIEGESLEDFKPRMAALPLEPEEDNTPDECLQYRKCYAVLENQGSRLVLPTRETDPVALARASFEIERIARAAGLRITYQDLKSIPLNGFSVSTITITKQEILRTTREHRLFPPKTTRHVVPSRPLGVRVPIEWLTDTDLQMVQKKFLKHLQSKKLARMPEGSQIGSRRYQEEIFVFE